MDSSKCWIIFLLGLAFYITQRNIAQAIQDKVYIRLFSSEHSAAKSENVTLMCEICFAYAEPTVTWSRDGVVLGSEKDGGWGIVIRNMSALKGEKTPLYRANILVINVEETHSYTCMAIVGTSSLSATVKVRVGPAPKMDIKPIPSIIPPPGRNVDLLCNAESREPAKVTWLQQPGYQNITGREVDFASTRTAAGVNMYRLLLKLHPVAKNASYTCSAENEFGTKAYTIVIVTVPVNFGRGCQFDLDCATKYSQCIDEECDCPPLKPIFVESKQECFPVSRLSGECTFSKQCEASDNMTYCSTKGYCKCVEDSVYSMDLKRCYIPVSEPYADEVYAGLGGALGLITVGNLILYCIRKRTDDPNEEEEQPSSFTTSEHRTNQSFSQSSDAASQRASRANSTRSTHSTLYRRQFRTDNNQAVTHLILAQLQSQSLLPPVVFESDDSRTVVRKTSSSKLSSKSDTSSNNLSVLTDDESRKGSMNKINKSPLDAKNSAENTRKHSV